MLKWLRKSIGYSRKPIRIQIISLLEECLTIKTEAVLNSLTTDFAKLNIQKNVKF